MTTFQSTPGNGSQAQQRRRRGGFGQRVDRIGTDAQQFFDDARGAVTDLSDTLDLKGRVERNPYGMVAAALGVGYVLGGGLFTPHHRAAAAPGRAAGGAALRQGRADRHGRGARAAASRRAPAARAGLGHRGRHGHPRRPPAAERLALSTLSPTEPHDVQRQGPEEDGQG